MSNDTDYINPITPPLKATLKSAMTARGYDLREDQTTGEAEFEVQGLVWRQQTERGEFAEASNKYPFNEMFKEGPLSGVSYRMGFVWRHWVPAHLFAESEFVLKADGWAVYACYTDGRRLQIADAEHPLDAVFNAQEYLLRLWQYKDAVSAAQWTGGDGA